MLRNCILSFLAGIAFCWLILNPLVSKVTGNGTTISYQDIVTTKVSVKRDTVFIPRVLEKTIVLRVPVAKIVDRTVLDTLRLDSYAKQRYAANFTRKVYEDTVSVEKGVQVGYKADVTGILNNMTLSYKDYRPQVVVHDSVTTEKTIIKAPPRALYVGIGASSSLKFLGPHVMYQDKVGNSFRVGLNALSIPKGGVPEMTLSYSKRLSFRVP